MKSRFLKSEILKKSKSPAGCIIVLTGARQTGKTTLAQKCFPRYAYLSIEDPVLRMEYSGLTAAQWNHFYPRAILDEIQKEPKLVESIKAVFDQYQEPEYLLLGSSQLLLLQKVRESLAGRCRILEVYPLTIPEILSKSWAAEPSPSFWQRFLLTGRIPSTLTSFQLYSDYAKKEDTFRYYLNNGGYPALVNDELDDEDKYYWLKNYVRTYLERDIRDLADFKSLDPFIKIQKMTSILTGQLVNFTQLGKESGVSSKTAQRFLHYLEISYQTIMLQPYHTNELKRLVRTPKLHYLDPGVQKAIIQKRGELAGNEYESAVVAEIFKQAQNIKFEGSFFHLRTHDGREVDLLIESENGFIAFEIKMVNKVTLSDARHLRSLSTILHKPVLQNFLISNDPVIKILDENILALPAAMFLS